MNTRLIASLLTVVGICTGTSHLKADESRSGQDTQVVCEPGAGDECRLDRTDVEAWMICTEWMAYVAAIAIDEVIEPTVANESEPEEADETLAETIKDKVLIQEFQCVEGFDGWIVERDFEAEGLTEEKDESLESGPVVGEETVQVDADDAVEEATTDESETTEEEIVANEELTGGSIWIAVFDANFDEGGLAADESTQEETTVEETIEAIESAEVESNVEVADAAVEEAILGNATDNVETEDSVVAQTAEEIAINGDLALNAEPSSEESTDIEASAEEPTEESSEQKIDEAITVEESVDAAEMAIDEATAVEEYVETTEALEVENAVDVVETTIEEVTIIEETANGASSVAVEALETESFEQEAIEAAQAVDIEEQVSEEVGIAVKEDVTTDSVAQIYETLEVAEPPVEALKLQDTAIESTTVDEVNEPEVRTVRTIEVGDCKITIQSERQMDEFELLNMLWEAVDQLEAEMD